jgi:hypothetical protein
LVVQLPNTLHYNLHDPTGTSMPLADSGSKYVGRILYDGFGGVLSSTLPFTPTSPTGGVAHATTGLVQLVLEFFGNMPYLLNFSR